MLTEVIFFGLAFMIFLAGLLVIFSKNPVQSVLFLVVVFCLSAQLFVLLEVDFLAMVLIIVYVGAIAVLFLFIVMMLNIRVVELSEILNRYFPLATIVGLIIFSEIVFSLYYSLGYNYSNIFYLDWYKSFLNHSNVVSLGLVLYTYFSPFLIISGILLLLAMISSIMLTLDLPNSGELNLSTLVKKQSIPDQVDRPTNDLNFWRFY
jgi:NADH-quinone oxidoreductase subunit J|uniref:NADH-ubiquinone oxidoreductase chain 6 n=1 Tax=Vermamoeba vermiformis TaxID=5778 RepID=D4PBL3_VERVE|nr:NADH dehydrogenase subunit 6 [Vermamoeba vermiformis]ADD62225.1 NADH dehydrogenase subunit 6 [Vermamoeba vermiformis]